MAESFGEYVKECRKSKKITVRKLGELVGVDFSYIGKIELDKKKPSDDLLEKLIEILEMDRTVSLRLLGHHVDTIGIKLEKSNPDAVDILYKLNELLDEEGKKALNYIMVEVKSGVDKGNIDKSKLLKAIDNLVNKPKNNSGNE
jgi:HTH-type transcriptional regulator, competence development regulator